MISDKELADACVRVGIATRIDLQDPHSGHAYHIEPDPPLDGWLILSDEFLVTDWRVAGACMERLTAEQRVWMMVEVDEARSLPRAIIEVCLRALGELE